MPSNINVPYILVLEDFVNDDILIDFFSSLTPLHNHESAGALPSGLCSLYLGLAICLDII
jgi:hypothetical protein